MAKHGNLKFGIPDINLACSPELSINPSSFVGHYLVVLFCSTDAEQGAREIEAYAKHSREFAAEDAWILAFGDQCGLKPQVGQPLMIADQDRHAWVAFRDLVESPESLDRGDIAQALDPMALLPEEPRETGERERRPSHPMDQQQPHLSSTPATRWGLTTW